MVTFTLFYTLLLEIRSKGLDFKGHLGRVLLGSTVFSWLGFLMCSIRKKTFSVGLVDQLFQPALSYVETVEKALAATAVIYADLLKSATSSCRVASHVSTKNGWKSVLLGNLNPFNLNWLRLKRLTPIEHDLTVGCQNWACI